MVTALIDSISDLFRPMQFAREILHGERAKIEGTPPSRRELAKSLLVDGGQYQVIQAKAVQRLSGMETVPLCLIDYCQLFSLVTHFRNIPK